MCYGLSADESLAPMDDFLRSSLPADVIPAIMNRLPELNVTQPDKVETSCLSRSKHTMFACCQLILDGASRRQYLSSACPSSTSVQPPSCKGAPTSFVLWNATDGAMQVLQEVLSPLRSKAPKHMTLIKALAKQLSSFDDFELDRLQHAFVKLSGGDSRVATLTPERIR